MALDPRFYDVERFEEDQYGGYAEPGKGVTSGIVGILGSLLPGLQWLGPVLGGLSSVMGLWGRSGAEKAAEERQRKREALQRAIMMSRSFEEAGRRWGY